MNLILACSEWILLILANRMAIAIKGKVTLIQSEKENTVYSKDCHSGVYLPTPVVFDCACITGVWGFYSRFCETPELFIGGDSYCFRTDNLKLSQIAVVGNFRSPLDKSLSHFRGKFQLITRVFTEDEHDTAIDATGSWITITGMRWTLYNDKGDSVCLQPSVSQKRIFCMFSEELEKYMDEKEWNAVVQVKQGCHSPDQIEAEKCYKIMIPNERWNCDYYPTVQVLDPEKNRCLGKDGNTLPECMFVTPVDGKLVVATSNKSNTNASTTSKDAKITAASLPSFMLGLLDSTNSTKNVNASVLLAQANNTLVDKVKPTNNTSSISKNNTLGNISNFVSDKDKSIMPNPAKGSSSDTITNATNKTSKDVATKPSNVTSKNTTATEGTVGNSSNKNSSSSKEIPVSPVSGVSSKNATKTANQSKNNSLNATDNHKELNKNGNSAFLNSTLHNATNTNKVNKNETSNITESKVAKSEIHKAISVDPSTNSPKPATGLMNNKTKGEEGVNKRNKRSMWTRNAEKERITSMIMGGVAHCVETMVDPSFRLGYAKCYQVV